MLFTTGILAGSNPTTPPHFTTQFTSVQVHLFLTIKISAHWEDIDLNPTKLVNMPML